MKDGAGIVIFGVLLLAALGGIFWLNYSTWKYNKTLTELEESGVRTTGTVIRKDANQGNTRSVDTYSVTFKYIGRLPDGTEKELVSEAQVDENTYNQAAEGFPIEIMYKADHPREANIPGNDNISVRIFLTILVDALLLIAVIMIIWQSAKSGKS